MLGDAILSLMAKLKASEKDVQASCLAYLSAKKYFFFRLNNMPVYQEDHYRRLPEFTPKGLPDCILVRSGKFVAIEFKSTIGKLSDDQVEFSRKLIKAGGDYFVARSIDDLQKIGL